MKEYTRNIEITKAFDSISDKVKSAIAQAPLVYTYKDDKDGKFYIELNAELPDGKKISGYIPFGFTQEKNAIDFQKICLNWFIRQN